MRVTVERLRRGIVVAAALLITVVLGFFFYGRYRFRHFERDLPGRLGANIQQTANGFSYTQSSQGHALFTLKASKELQLKSGHVLLHNVDITLYGPPGSQRTDHIFGSDFDYDQAHGIAASRGDVEIELEGATRPPASGVPPENVGANTIRVRTQALTFVQSTGEANTSAPVEFQLPRAAGTSTGADYNSRTGSLVLQSQVRITTSSNGKPAVIEAAKATLERASLQGFLVQPTMQYETESGSADAATIFFRKDGTTERVDAQGNVRMRTDTGVTVRSATARILMDAKSQPTETDLSGGVQFASEQPQERMEGSAERGKLLFASVGGRQGGTTTALRHAEFRQNAHFMDVMTGVGNDRRGRTERTMQAGAIDVAFGPPLPSHQPQAQKAIAEGNPVMTLRQAPSKGPQQTTRISGDRLVATLGQDNALQALDGTGHTEVDRSSTDGSRDRSRGDVLHATFLEQPGLPRRGAAHGGTQTGRRRGVAAREKISSAPRMETELATAVQDGNVMLEETAASHRPAPETGAAGAAEHKTGTVANPGRAAQPTTLIGWAQHAEYTAANQVLHLTGHPRITDGATMQMAAEDIEYHRDTQNASAQGDVKATYAQVSAGAAANATSGGPPSMGGNGPVHILAARASMDHAANQSTFYGAAGAPARMWQDADSLLAPVILIDRNKNLLQAWGEAGPHRTGEPQVNANFTTAMGARRQQTVVRVRSATLVYSDRERRGDFRGSVTAQDETDLVRCDDALIFLKPAEAGPGKTAEAGKTAAAKGTASGNAQLQRMIAMGHVVFTQPGRRGNGEKLVYTADDGQYVLTGTRATPPAIWDQTHGTTTGEKIAFNSENDAIEVIGGKGAAVTNTRTPK